MLAFLIRGGPTRPREAFRNLSRYNKKMGGVLVQCPPFDQIELKDLKEQHILF